MKRGFAAVSQAAVHGALTSQLKKPPPSPPPRAREGAFFSVPACICVSEVCAVVRTGMPLVRVKRRWEALPETILATTDINMHLYAHIQVQISTRMSIPHPSPREADAEVVLQVRPPRLMKIDRWQNAWYGDTPRRQ